MAFQTLLGLGSCRTTLPYRFECSRQAATQRRACTYGCVAVTFSDVSAPSGVLERRHQKKNRNVAKVMEPVSAKKVGTIKIPGLSAPGPFTRCAPYESWLTQTSVPIASTSVGSATALARPHSRMSSGSR